MSPWRASPVAVGPGVHHERDELGGGHGEVRPVDHKLGPVKRHGHIALWLKAVVVEPVRA